MSLLFLFSVLVQAAVLSPTASEVSFSYTAALHTHESGTTAALINKHRQFLYGMMQSPELAATFPGINHRTPGVGAPSWPAEIEVKSDESDWSGRTITYSATGKMLINKLMAERVLRDGYWDTILPYDMDQFLDWNCTGGEKMEDAEGFWYYVDPWEKGCEHLTQSPMAHAVHMEIKPVEAAAEDTRLDLGRLRSGDTFRIVTINGYSDNTKKRGDLGRKAYYEMNDWFYNQGFTKTELKKFKNRPLVQFEKDFTALSGKTVHVEVLRLLADTNLDEGRHVTFAKFLRQAIKEANVVVYAGHSGDDASLDPKLIEKRAGGPLEFDHDKPQLFFFDACLGYSYFLPLFEGRKTPGSLNVLTFGLTSQFGYEHAMHKALFRHLLNFKDDQPLWQDVMVDMERSLRGMTFLINMDVI